MKKNVGILVLIGLGLLGACSGNEKTHNAVTPSSTTQQVTADQPHRMQRMHVEDTIRWRDNVYYYNIQRSPDADLPQVKDEAGKGYVDNRIILEITRNQAPFVQHAFTKQDFLSWLDEDFKKCCILEGLVFDKITPNGLVFAASVCDPSQGDLYTPFLIIISSDGRMQIQRDTVLDTEAKEVEEDGV